MAQKVLCLITFLVMLGIPARVLAFQSISTIGSKTVIPHSFTTGTSSRRPLEAIPVSEIFHPEVINSVSPHPIISVAAATTTTAVSSITTLLLADEFNVLDLVKNIGIGIASFVLISFGLVYVFATFIIPQAAVELEKQIKEMNPDLWAQYESKLKPGEKLAERPDLIQELGTELRRIQLEEFDKQQQVQAQQQEVSTTGSTTIVNNDGQQELTNPSSSTIIDVEVVKSDETKTTT
jgi:hypothetical protein